MNAMKTAIAAIGLISTVAGHGYITAPPARMPGPAMKAACGQQMFNNQNSDHYGNIQGELQQTKQADSGYNATACNVFQCKAFQFADNTANVQTYKPGDVVSMVADIRAPHDGTANVSIVKTSSNEILGSMLKTWDQYALTSKPIPDDDKNFNITIPSDIGSQCTTAGDCVIQWWWDARSIDQTYEACIDFTVGGSSDSTPAPAATSTASTSAVATSSTAAATSAAAAPTPSSNSKAGLPKEFTLYQFTSWLKVAADPSSSKVKRAARAHARQVHV